MSHLKLLFCQPQQVHEKRDQTDHLIPRSTGCMISTCRISAISKKMFGSVFSQFLTDNHAAHQNTLLVHSWIKFYVNVQVDWSRGPLSKLWDVLRNGSIDQERLISWNSQIECSHISVGFSQGGSNTVKWSRILPDKNPRRRVRRHGQEGCAFVAHRQCTSWRPHWHQTEADSKQWKSNEDKNCRVKTTQNN